MKIYDGKYEFYEDERGMLMCRRHGELWRSFVGDKAVHGLFSHARDLEEKVSKLEALIEQMIPGLGEIDRDVARKKLAETK